MENPIIDIHCHTFNGDDIALQGFFRRIVLDDGGTLSWLAERWVQHNAPGYQKEVAVLDHLLGISGPDSAVSAAEIEAALQPVDLEAEFSEFVMELSREDPALFAATQEAAGAPLATGAETAELFGIGDRLDFVKLLGESRLGLTRRLIADNSPATVFTPMMVDLDHWLTKYGRPAQTTVAEQVELQSKIARVGMLGKIPDHPNARVHPFFGFDPRRVYEDSGRSKPWDLSQLHAAVTEDGFVGVKLYPPMGWRPSHNFTTEDIRSQAEAAAYDEILTEFFGWCQDNQVPVTPHSNRSMGTESAYDEFSSPSEWNRVLERFPELRLNLGHFGGFGAPTSNPWPYYFAELTDRFDNVYVDVGNQRPHEATHLQHYLARLDQLQNVFPQLTNRVMLGTDWYMDVQEPHHEEYVTNYLKAYGTKFGTEAAERFHGGNARDFLGFKDPTNPNNQRLRAFYATHAPGQEPEWLET